jgi:Putative MetA-pathway of phenol degradation
MPRLTSAFFLFVIAGILAFPANAQTCGTNTQTPISTDRPQITSSSIVVPCGSLQFENGFQETGTGGPRTFDLPETSIRFGIANKTELRLGVPDYFFNDNTASGFATGFGDMSLGFKQQLGPTHGFDVSLIPSVSLPTGANAISSHGYDPTLQLPWSHSLSKNWTVAGMFQRLLRPPAYRPLGRLGRILRRLPPTRRPAKRHRFRHLLQTNPTSATRFSLRLRPLRLNPRPLHRPRLLFPPPGISIQMSPALHPNNA